MKIELEQFHCKVIKEEGDPYFHRSGWSDAESTFLYHVLQGLKRMGYDVIKKRMWKDGHLVSEEQQYIRTRSGLETHKDFAIYNSAYAVYDAGEKFNQDGEVYLTRVWGVD